MISYVIHFVFIKLRQWIPFSFKIDLKNADPERVEKQIEKVFDIPSDECIKVKYLFSPRLFENLR